VRYRQAGAEDIEAIATIHADSWRLNYRGAYSDAFLDGAVDDNRRAVWTERLRHLKVLEGNTAAQAFYQARGGACVASEVSRAPGGGRIVGLLYAWADPSVLLPRDAA